jgi:hypothetical protein
MRQFGGANDGIDRAGRYAERAADACLLVDERSSFRLGNPVRSVQWNRAQP